MFSMIVCPFTVVSDCNEFVIHTTVSGDALNLSKWQTFFPNWGGRAPGAFSSNNVVVNNDMLELRSAYDPSFDFPVGSDCCEYGNYTTSVVYGKQPVDFKG